MKELLVYYMAFENDGEMIEAYPYLRDLGKMIEPAKEQNYRIRRLTFSESSDNKVLDSFLRSLGRLELVGMSEGRYCSDPEFDGSTKRLDRINEILEERKNYNLLGRLVNWNDSRFMRKYAERMRNNPYFQTYAKLEKDPPAVITEVVPGAKEIVDSVYQDHKEMLGRNSWLRVDWDIVNRCIADAYNTFLKGETRKDYLWKPWRACEDFDG